MDIIKILKQKLNKIFSPKLKFEKDLTQGLLRIGNDYGFCYLPEKLLNAESVVYSFGAGEDISVETAIVNKFNCKVYIFDPTPKSILHFKSLIENTLKGEVTLIGDSQQHYSLNKSNMDLLQYYPYALWNEDTMVRFYEPINKNHVSHSITNIQASETYIDVVAKQLKSIIDEIGNDKIDLLKLDIEGAEYMVLDNILDQNISIKAIYLEFHHSAELNYKQNQLRIQKYIDQLFEKGYKVLHESNQRNLIFFKS